jgi:general secretion pathway protein C
MKLSESLATHLSRRLKKNFGWLVAPLAAVALLESTEGIAQVVGVTFGPEPAALSANLASSRRPRHPPPFHTTSAEAILTHNPFDSQYRPASRSSPSPSESEDAPLDPDPRDAPVCEGVRVSGIVSSTDPEWSLASFEESGPPATPSHTLLRRRGGEVGARRVEFIAWDRVWMTGATGLCQVSMFAPRAEPAPAVVPRGAARPELSVPAPPLEGWIIKGIEVVGPTERNIDRGIIPRLIEKQAELIKNTQARLEVEGGKRLGFRVTGVRPESLLGTLGLVDGDRLQSINGYDLTDGQAAMEAYAHLLQADHLVLLVNRGGKDVRLALNVR